MGKLPVISLCVSVVVSASPVRAFAQVAPYPAAAQSCVVPDYLAVGNQMFEPSVGGFRTYLETKRTSDPQLFAALDPKVARLESQVTAARVVLVAGLVVGLISSGYAILGRKSCPEPAITDPNFAADSAAWGACNDQNLNTSAKFGFLGLGAITLGGLGWLAITPKRSDLFDLVNAHNALGHDTMRLQIGYDPTSRLALGGISTTF